jgi:hypothetical protein
MESGVSAGWTSVGQRFCRPPKSRHRLDFHWLADVHYRGKTVTKPLPLSRLGLPLSEKQIPQVVENLESGGKPKEALETAALRPRQFPSRQEIAGFQVLLYQTVVAFVLRFMEAF